MSSPLTVNGKSSNSVQFLRPLQPCPVPVTSHLQTNKQTSKQTDSVQKQKPVVLPSFQVVLQVFLKRKLSNLKLLCLSLLDSTVSELALTPSLGFQPAQPVRAGSERCVCMCLACHSPLSTQHPHRHVLRKPFHPHSFYTACQKQIRFSKTSPFLSDTFSL